MGLQGSIPKEQQIRALHIFVDELDIQLAKPLLMDLYTSKMAEVHEFPLGIQMRFVLGHHSEHKRLKEHQEALSVSEHMDID